MKKLIYIVAFLTVVAGYGRAAQVYTYPIQVSVSMNEIDLQAIVYPMHFGTVDLNSTVLSNQPQGLPRCTLHNKGYADVTLFVSATISTGWELGTTLDDVGVNKCVIAGIFTKPILSMDNPYEFEYTRDLVPSDFADNDVLGPASVLATTNCLARDNTASDPDDPESVKGYHVMAIPGQEERSMRFLVKTPTQDTLHLEQFIDVVIGALVE